MSNSGDQTQQRDQKDGPEYRSVIIQPLAAHPMPRSFSLLPKLTKPTMTTLNISYSNNKQEVAAGSSSFSRRWKVQELSELPTDYLLVRTNVYVKDASPQQVADRICNTLKNLSITTDLKAFEWKVSFTSIASR